VTPSRDPTWAPGPAVHGHRWKDSGGAFVDNPTVGPDETITARSIEDNPGRRLYHCDVSPIRTMG
jgi:FtsP/CotA-like multicopper oxidase with cupredoxin domain